MTKLTEQQRHYNLVAGAVMLVIAVVVVLLIGGLMIAKETQPEPRHQIIYVSNAGNLGYGDPVYLNGQRVGRVVEVELVQHDGGVQARVDFILYESVQKLELPVDSRVTVVGPGLIAGPRLVLNYGSKGAVINAGDEMTNVVPAAEVDDVGKLAQSVDEIAQLADHLREIFDDPAFAGGIRAMLTDLRTTAEEINARAQQYGPALGEFAKPLRDAPQRLNETRTQLVANTRDLSQRLADLQQALDNGAANADEMSARLSDAVASLRENSRLSSEGAAESDDPELQQLFLRVRWLSASLAAQYDAARFDPSQAGGDPAGQQVREHFNGGKRALAPFGGDTDITKFD